MAGTLSRPFLFSNMQKRPCFLPAPGRPSLEITGSPQSEGARNAKGPYGPTRLDASRHRGLSKLLETQVHQTNGVPRAMFIGLLRVGLGGRPVRSLRPLQTPRRSTGGPRPLGLACADKHANRPTGPSGGPGVRTARRTRRGLDRRRGILRRISNAPNRPPLPASASGVLIKRPSVVEAGYMEYMPIVGL